MMLNNSGFIGFYYYFTDTGTGAQPNIYIGGIS